MSTIREAALAAVGGRLPRGTGVQAQAALAAVEAREQEMFEDIVEAGVALGATRSQVHDILVTAGMSEPDYADETTDETGGLDALHAKIDDLAAKLDDAIARGTRALSRRRR